MENGRECLQIGHCLSVFLNTVDSTDRFAAEVVQVDCWVIVDGCVVSLQTV